MRGFLSLLSINLTGKLFSVGIFALLARVLRAEDLAYIGLIPAISVVVLVLFSFGVGTLLERDVPKLMVTDLEAADALMRTGYWLCLLAIPFMLVVVWGFSDRWRALLFSQYALDREAVRWIALPIAACMISQINGWMLITRGAASQYGFISVYGDIFAKATALGFYVWRPGELSVFLGLAVGQLPFLVLALWFHRGWLYKRGLLSPLPILSGSGVFYVESIFNVLQDRGDSLLVSSVLGPIAMAHYYVGKSIAGQLTVFFAPLTMIIIPKFAASFGRGVEHLERSFRDVWSVAPAACVWLSSCLGAASPFLLRIFAGPEYSDAWQLALILSWVVAAGTINAIGTRVLLIMGGSSERFKVTLLQAGIVLTLILSFRHHLGAEGVAAVWLVATILTTVLVRVRAAGIGFRWPPSNALFKALLVSVPVPLVSLYVLGHVSSTPWVYGASCAVLSGISFVVLVALQDPLEEEAALKVVPRRLHPIFLKMRRLKLRVVQ